MKKRSTIFLFLIMIIVFSSSNLVSVEETTSVTTQETAQPVSVATPQETPSQPQQATQIAPTVTQPEKQPLSEKQSTSQKEEEIVEKRTLIPQGSLPGGFQELGAPAKFIKIDISRGGKQPIGVALDDQGIAYKLNNSYGWDKIDTQSIKPAPDDLKKGLNELLPDGTLVALRVISDGPFKGKYVQITSIKEKAKAAKKDLLYIDANATSCDEPSAQFIIKKSKKHPWFGLTHAKAEGKNLHMDGCWVWFDNKNFDEPGHDKEHFTIECARPNKLDDVTINFAQSKKGYLTITPGGKNVETGRVMSNEYQKQARKDEASNQPPVHFALEIIGTQLGRSSGTLSNSLKDIAIGTDGTIWATTTGDAVIKYTDSGWQQVVGTGSAISVGNQNEVWIVSSNNELWRKKDPVHDNTYWQKIPGTGTTISCGGDGTVWMPGVDLQLQRLDRHARQWNPVIRPADFRMDNPKLVKVADRCNIVFLDYANKAWHLIPGKTGTQGDDWIKIPGETKMKTIAIGIDGTLMGVTMDDKVVVRHPDEEDYKALDRGRGTEIRAGQIVKITTGNNWGFRPVWTHAASSYDPKGTVQPPNDHLELLVSENFPKKLNDPKEDYRHETASFITILHQGNPLSTEPIKYGDNIEILSLYAAPGNESKAGVLGKSRKWWSHNNHFKWGKNWNDVLVSINTHPQTKDGSQLFTIVSPSGQTGLVRSNDIIEIESLAPTSQNRKIYVNNWNRSGKEYKEILISATSNQDLQENESSFWGARDTGGDQHFRLRAINKRDDVPKTSPTPSGVKDKNLLVSPLDVFDKLAETGQFWRKTEIVEQEKKIALETKVTHGIGVLKEIRNGTVYPLDADDLGIVPREDAITGLTRKLFTTLSLKGFAEDEKIENFGSDKMVKLNKMFGRGYAWVEESLQNPGKTTITFLARATDKGGIEIDFATKLGTSAQIKIIIGNKNNTKSQIIYQDPETNNAILISEVDAQFTPLAKVAAGRFVPYWVSIYDGFIMVGVGQPGESVFISGFLPEPVAVNRYGFSSEDGPVDYAEIQTAASLISLTENTIYSKMDGEINLPAAKDGQPTFINLPMRVSNEASYSFDIQAKENGTAIFANEKGESYKIIIGANNNNNLIIQKNNNMVIVQNTQILKDTQLSETKARKFWITLIGGQILVGRGDFGNNILLAWQDAAPLSNIKKFGFVPSNVPQKISNIVAAPPVTIGTENAEIVYKAKIERFPYRGGMTVIRPFAYDIAQIEQSVKLKNTLTGRLFPVLGTPQQGAFYEFRLSLDATGLPNIVITNEPDKSPALILLERGAMEAEIQADLKSSLADADAMLLEATAQGLHRSADTFMQGTMGPAAGVAMAAGAGLTAGAVAADIGTGAIKRAGAREAAQIRAAGRAQQVQAKFAFKALDAYVLTEQPDREVGAQTSIPDEAFVNQQAIKMGLNQMLMADWNDPSQIKLLIKLYQDVINRITHPYILQETALKKRIMADLEKFARNIKDTGNMDNYQDMIGLLVGAITNAYLINKNEKTDQDAKERWYNAVAELGDLLIKYAMANPTNEITIPPLWGQYLWFPNQMTNGQGWITFQAQGQNDLFICFSQDVTDVRNSDEKMYEVVLGAFDNKKAVVRIKSLGRSADESTSKDLTLHSLRPKTYWVAFDNGIIYLGSGQKVGENIIQRWEDPYKWENINFIGIGSWDAPVKISQLATNIYQPDAAASAAQTDQTVQATPMPDQAAQQEAQPVPTPDQTEQAQQQPTQDQSAAAPTEVQQSQQPAEQ